MRWSSREEYVASLHRRAQELKQNDRAQRLLRQVPRFPGGEHRKKLLQRLQETGKFVIIGSWYDCVQDCHCQMIVEPNGEGYIEAP